MGNNHQLPKDKVLAAPIESTEAINAMTMQTLVGSLDGLMHQLRPPTNFAGEEIPQRALDGGVRSAIEMAAITICNRITDVINDAARWTAKSDPDRWKQEEAIRQEALAEIKDRREAVRKASSPSARMHVRVIRRQGEFIAFIGDIDRPNSFIFGVGLTAEAALEDFNRQFSLKADQINTVVVEPAAQPKKDQPTDENPVDSGDGKKPAQPESGRASRRRNRNPDGTAPAAGDE